MEELHYRGLPNGQMRKLGITARQRPFNIQIILREKIDKYCPKFDITVHEWPIRSLGQLPSEHQCAIAEEMPLTFTHMLLSNAKRTIWRKHLGKISRKAVKIIALRQATRQMQSIDRNLVLALSRLHTLQKRRPKLTIWKD